MQHNYFADFHVLILYVFWCVVWSKKYFRFHLRWWTAIEIKIRKDASSFLCETKFQNHPKKTNLGSFIEPQQQQKCSWLYHVVCTWHEAPSHVHVRAAIYRATYAITTRTHPTSHMGVWSSGPKIEQNFIFDFLRIVRLFIPYSQFLLPPRCRKPKQGHAMSPGRSGPFGPNSGT